LASLGLGKRFGLPLESTEIELIDDTLNESSLLQTPLCFIYRLYFYVSTYSISILGTNAGLFGFVNSLSKNDSSSGQSEDPLDDIEVFLFSLKGLTVGTYLTYLSLHDT
jgi:hypothetical protein